MPRFLAIDADAHGLFVAAATVRGGSVKIEHALASTEDSQPLAPATAKALGARLKELLKQAGVAPAPALVCLGRERVILKEVKYPPTPAADEPAVVRFQATKDLTESPDEVAVDYLPVPPADPTAPDRQALVVFLRRDLLAAARVMCEAAGLKLAGVTPRPFAVAAAAARAAARGEVPAPEPADAPVAVLTLTDRGGEFTVVRNGWVKFSRTVPAPAVASEAALVAEVRRNLAVYSGMPGGGDVESVLLAEADAGTEGWSGRLRAGLPVPVHAFDPLANTVAGDAVPVPLRGRFVGPVGLVAARAAGPLPINFHQTRQPRAAASPNRTRVMLAVLVGILLLGFGVVGGLLAVGSAERKVRTLRQDLQQIEDEIARNELDQKRLAAADDFANREVVWVDELYDLADRFPDIARMRITALEGTTLPPPTEKERQREEAQLKANPLAAKTAPPKPIGKLRLTVAAENSDMPDRLVSSFKSEPRFYVGARTTGGALIPGARTPTQQYTIEIQIARRKPEEYRRRLAVTAPKAPLAPAPKAGGRNNQDDEPAPFGPGFGGFDGGFTP